MIKRLFSKTIIIVCVLVCVLFLISCSKSKYDKAKALYINGEYEEAKAIFVELEDYEDSASLIIDCDYKIACDLMDSEDYKGAREILSELNDYEDSETLIIACDYEIACALMDSGDYNGAQEILSGLNDYEDSEALLATCAIVYAQQLFDDGDFIGAAENARAAGDAEGVTDIVKKSAYEWLKGYLFSKGEAKSEGKAYLLIKDVDYHFFDFLSGESSLAFWFSPDSIFESTINDTEIWGDISMILYDDNDTWPVCYMLYLSPQSKSHYIYQQTYNVETGATLNVATFAGQTRALSYVLYNAEDVGGGYTVAKSPTEESKKKDAEAICFMLDSIQEIFNTEGVPFSVQDMGYSSYVPTV